MANTETKDLLQKNLNDAGGAFNRLEDDRLEEVAGGNSSSVPNPLMVMLDMYYQIAMEKTDPAARAQAAGVYNETLEKLMREGINCEGYRFIEL